MPPPIVRSPVMVTGAAGFSGSALVKTLRERGERVQAVIHCGGRELAAATAVGDDLIIARVDLPELGALDALEPPRIIYHLAGAVDPRLTADPALCRRVIVEGTEALAHWALARHSRVVFVSSIAAMGFYDAPGGADERSPCRPTTPYGRCKLEAEERLAALASRGLSYAAVRPPTLYGPEDRYNFLSLARAVAARRFVLFGGGHNRMSVMGIDNLVAALVTVGENNDNGLFVADDGEATTLSDIAGAIHRALGRSGRLPSLPKIMGAMAAHVLEPTCRALGVEPPLSPARLRTLTSDFAFRIDRLRGIGYRPVLATAAGIAQAVAGYQRRGVL